MIRYRKARKSEQKGVVLIIALVFLIALTAVAVALMQNSSSDVKMSGATEERAVAIQETISASDEVILRQLAGGAGTNGFAANLVTFPNDVTDSLTDRGENQRNDNVTAVIAIPNNPFELEADCPASRQASSTGVFTCNVLNTTVTKSYGRTNNNTIVVESGIAQELLR